MHYKAILLDADRTLFDYDAAEARALERACVSFSIPYSGAALCEYRIINEQLWKDHEENKISTAALRLRRFERFLPVVGSTVRPEAFSTTYLRYLAQGSELFAESEHVCKTLASKYSLALVTNGIADVQRPRFNASPLVPYFKSIIVSEEAGASKPDRRIFDLALKSLGITNSRDALMVGDSINADIRGGIDAGMDTCWVNLSGASRGSIQPTYEISEISELLGVLS